MDSKRFSAFRTTAVCGLALCVMLLAGCGGGRGTTTIKGTVKTADGKPVTGGTLTIAPVDAGGEASPVGTQVGSDGTFSVAAPQGKAKLTYVDPGAQFPKDYTPKPSEPAPLSPFAGMSVVKPDVEIKAGESLDVTIGKGGK